MAQVEGEGKTVAEAVENALKTAGLRREQVEVQIVREGSSGFMGLGVKSAVVRIEEKRWAADGSPLPPEAAPKAKAPVRAPRTEPRPASSGTNRDLPRGSHGGGRPEAPKPAPRPVNRDYPPAAQGWGRPASSGADRDVPPGGQGRGRPERRPERTRHAPHASSAPRPQRERSQERPPLTAEQAVQACEQATALLKDWLPLMDFADARVKAAWDPSQERVQASVETPEADRLVGRDGRTLESLQFLLTLVLTRRFNTPVAVWVDTGGYWEKKEKALMAEALKGVELVKSTKRPFRLPPMEAPLRRLIHRSLAENPDVVTSSEGEGPWRKIVLKPRQG